MTQTLLCPYDDRTWLHPDNVVLEEESLCPVGTTFHPQFLWPTNPRLDVARTRVPRHPGLNSPPQLVHLPYSSFPVRCESTDDTLADRGNLRSPHSAGVYNPWGSLHPSPNLLPDTTCDISPPIFYCSTSDPILYPGPHQSPWPAPGGHAQDNPPLAPSNSYPSIFPLHNASPSSDLNLHYTPVLSGGALDASASYPCLWTEGGAICNVMVQATRSRMNRHLHVYHGFGGSDTRQTRCYWVGCSEMMQQGSIARHTVTCHLQTKVTCPMCFKKLSRQDVISKHQRVCPAVSARR